MMKLLLVMFSVISPFSVQPAAVPAAHDMQWTVAKEETPEIVLAADRSGTVQHFRTLNDISLDDSIDDILANKGQPVHKEHDPYLGCPEYEFKDVTVGLCEDTGVVNYVHIDAYEKRLKLNQEWIDMDIEDIRDALGKPYYVAEDGEVFLRGSQALKVYMKPGSNQIEGIDLFDESVS
ncbi:hypothetical protein QP794_26605 [Paenibacillus sp. UMB7766-LJ446]|uniref:hypothetical protein n=2 Tax=Paenibacillus TaxID=44249 RepID=UPI0009A26A45|nr:hypothetical protein [Paenibacillus sp. 11B]MDK8193658.1 hypothetical protein [Paenibacillus sp. UMB7766-LJ446]MDN8590478.1 hypothetical protein [Paenibacillus sp. 11B]OPG95287.1 hypothetical protein B2I21_26810 [Chryseobacterium mucoviscidosis]